jgi:transposase
MSHPFDASRSLTVLEQDSTIIAVIEMSQSKWLVSAVVPGIERQPLKKLDPDEEALRNSCIVGATKLARPGVRSSTSSSLTRRDAMASGWRAGCRRATSKLTSSTPRASRCRANIGGRRPDRLDTELLMRAFLGWLRGEKRHCSMVAIPHGRGGRRKRPNRERGNLVTDQTRIVN